MNVYSLGNLYNFNNYLNMLASHPRLSDHHVFGLVFEKEYRDTKEVNRKFTVTKHEMVYVPNSHPTARTYSIADPAFAQKSSSTA